MAATWSYPNPSLAIALDRIEWMNTSARSMSARSAVLPASVRRSRTTPRLPRLTLTNTPPIPDSGPTEMKRVLSPCGGSTLMTSAPMSAMICVQYGPITIAVRSTTRTPVNGPLRMVRLLGRAHSHREAVTDVIAVPVGHHGKNQRLRVVTDRVDVFADVFDRPRRPVHPRSFRHHRRCDPAGKCDEDLCCDRTGFVRQPCHGGRHQFRAHRRIGRGVDALGHPRHGGRHDDIALHPVRCT